MGWFSLQTFEQLNLPVKTTKQISTPPDEQV